MSSYAEENSEWVYDWATIIDDLEAGLYESKELLEECREAACAWVTCACGNQCAALPRDNNWGEPTDLELSILGSEFSDIIDDITISDSDSRAYYAARARDILAQIEARATYLLAQQS